MHECPECGLYCHCHGDIDDLCLNLDEDVDACTHCPDPLRELDDDFEYESIESYRYNECD